DSRRSLSLRSFCFPKFLEPTPSRTGQGFRHRGRAADMNSSAVCHPHVTHASDIRMVASPFEVVTTRRPGGGNPRRRRRVLVVADEADIAEVIGYNLVTEDWEIFATDSGADALEHVHDIRPNVVLLELGVPQLDAWHIYRRLKEDPETHMISVIMATGRV